MVDNFDPDAYLAKPAFDPDQYLKSTEQPLGAGESFSRALVGGLPGGSVYEGMKGAALGQMGQGLEQVKSLQPWEMAKGAGNLALGGLGYASLPINAPLHAIVGEPTERAVSHVPVVGEAIAPYAGLAAETIAGFHVPTRLPSFRGTPRLPTEDPYGVTLSEGERTGDVAIQRKEQGAIRSVDPYTQPWVEQRRAQLQTARENLARSFDPEGQLIAHTPAEAGQLVSQGVRAEAGGARNTVQSMYETARTMPGEIDASAFENMTGNIRGDLSTGDNPVIIDRGTTPNAAKMMDYLDDQVAGLKIQNKAAPGFLSPTADDSRVASVNLAGVDQWRKNLSAMRKDAFGSAMPGQVNADGRASQAVLDAFDRHIDQTMNSNLFTGDPGTIDAWNQARQAYTDYRRTFTAGRNDPVGRAMQKIIGDPLNDPMTPGKLIDAVVGPQGATGSVPLAQRLRTVLGEDSPEWSAVKQGTFQKLLMPGEGERDFGPAMQAQRLSKFLNGDMGRMMYSPAEQQALRGYADLMRRIEPPAGTGSPSEPAIKDMSRAIASRIGGIVGAVIGHTVSPFPLMGELAGYTLGKQAEKRIEQAFGNMRANFPIVADQFAAWSKAQQRAAVQPNALNQRAAVAATAGLNRSLSVFGLDTKSLSGPVPAAAEDQQQTPGPDQQRKAGGRVDEQKKSTKTEAHYRGGTRHERCGLCSMFRPPHSCTSVRGDISAWALCDFYKRKGE